MIERVSCGDCVHFLPDEVGQGDGIGNCFRFEEYKLKNPSEMALLAARASMGRRCFIRVLFAIALSSRGNHEKS